MMIEIAMTENDVGRYYTLSDGKTRMMVNVCRHWTQVCTLNSASRVNRFPTGKHFFGADTLGQAVKAYKSSASKAMIEAVAQSERAIAGAAVATIAA